MSFDDEKFKEVGSGSGSYSAGFGPIEMDITYKSRSFVNEGNTIGYTELECLEIDVNDKNLELQIREALEGTKSYLFGSYDQNEKLHITYSGKIPKDTTIDIDSEELLESYTIHVMASKIQNESADLMYDSHTNFMKSFDLLEDERKIRSLSNKLHIYNKDITKEMLKYVEKLMGGGS